MARGSCYSKASPAPEKDMNRFATPTFPTYFHNPYVSHFTKAQPFAQLFLPGRESYKSDWLEQLATNSNQTQPRKQFSPLVLSAQQANRNPPDTGNSHGMTDDAATSWQL
ncbi:uncharacterized protein LOC144746877 isoform X1 [Ciona intestinalis]